MNYIIKGNKVYRKGTLAHFLDKRDVSVEEPTAEDLPKTLNSFKFVQDTLLKNNCTVIKLKHSEMLYSSALLSLLSELVPASQHIFIYIDVDDIRSLVKLSGITHVEVYPALVSTTEVPLYVQSEAIATSLEESCE